MRGVREIVAELAATGLTPEQIALVAELAAAAAKSTTPERSKHAEAQARYEAKRRSALIRSDHSDHPPLKERKEPKERNTPPKDPEGLRPSAPAAPTRADLERDFYNRGKQVLGKNAGGLLTSLLKAKQQDIALARSTLELAATKADPREFVAAACKTGPPAWHMNGHVPRPGSREDRAERTANAIRILREQAYPSTDDEGAGEAARDPDAGLLPFPKLA